MKVWLVLLVGFSVTIPSWAATEPTDIPKPATDGELPLYELGIGAASAVLPDYPGSDQYHWQTLPFPYAIYRGEIFRSDRRGMAKARFFHSDVFEINLSASGGLTTNSSRNRAREGMPDLDWTLELGPRALVRLHQFSGGGLVKLGLAARAAFSTNFKKVNGRGFVLEPELQFEFPNMPFKNWNAFALVTMMNADYRFMRYYYEVAPAYARANRPAYRAHSGYLGADLTYGVTLPVVKDRLQLLAFQTYASYQGAANRESPLMRMDHGWYHFVALIWTFERSKQTVGFAD